jgi:Ca2+-transporting ATPase
MNEPPRPKSAQILPASRLRVLIWLASIMAACTVGVVAWANRDYSAATAATMGWTTFVFAQLFNVFNARAEHSSVLRADVFSNRPLWIAIGGIALAQLAIVRVDWLRSFFEAAYLDGGKLVICFGVGSLVLWLEELRKLVVRRRA